MILFVKGYEAKAKLGGGLGCGIVGQKFDQARNHAERSWNRNFGEGSGLHSFR